MTPPDRKAARRRPLRCFSCQPGLEQAEHGRLFCLEGMRAAPHASRALRERVHQRSVEIGLEQMGVDVARAADRRRVAELLRHLFDGLHDGLLASRVIVDGGELAQRD